MSVVTFDTLAFAKKLEKHGFTAEQAEVMVELQKETLSKAIDSTLATKDDIARLDKELTLIKWVTLTTFALVALPFVRALTGL